ncbi:MAG: hypothetical protein ACLP7P_11865 [Rhodomicrobium sp.]
MIAVLTTIGTWIAGRFAAWGIGTIASLAFLGPLGPIVTGIATAIGSVISAVFEIIAALAKSAEGRVVLALLALGLGFLYLRFHYIEEGKAVGHSVAYAQGVAHGKTLVRCSQQRR